MDYPAFRKILFFKVMIFRAAIYGNNLYRTSPIFTNTVPYSRVQNKCNLPIVNLIIFHPPLDLVWTLPHSLILINSKLRKIYLHKNVMPCDIMFHVQCTKSLVRLKFYQGSSIKYVCSQGGGVIQLKAYQLVTGEREVQL